MIAPAITQSTPRSNVNADHRVIDLADLLEFLGDYNPNLGSPHVGLGDDNMNGYVDNADLIAFLAEWNPTLGVATGRDVLTAGELRAHGGNRKGYAGYEHEPWWTEFTLSGTPPTGVPNAEAGPLMQLARHRFYRADLGTWTRRDPLGYVDGMSLLSYTRALPIVTIDPFGLCANCSPFSSISADMTSMMPVESDMESCLRDCNQRQLDATRTCFNTYQNAMRECASLTRSNQIDSCSEFALSRLIMCLFGNDRDGDGVDDSIKSCRTKCWTDTNPLLPEPLMPAPFLPGNPSKLACIRGDWPTQCAVHSSSKALCHDCCLRQFIEIQECLKRTRARLTLQDWTRLANSLNQCQAKCDEWDWSMPPITCEPEHIGPLQ
ncbi:MAG: hypothetical protein KF768_13280 [Phycisphaeraceae bacterium]|nr:hypothetical protein [Phycisphaeraceae bacterium]